MCEGEGFPQPARCNLAGDGERERAGGPGVPGAACSIFPAGVSAPESKLWLRNFPRGPWSAVAWHPVSSSHRSVLRRTPSPHTHPSTQRGHLGIPLGRRWETWNRIFFRYPSLSVTDVAGLGRRIRKAGTGERAGKEDPNQNPCNYLLAALFCRWCIC